MGLFFGFTLTGKAMKAWRFQPGYCQTHGDKRSVDDFAFLCHVSLGGGSGGYFVTRSLSWTYDRGPMLALKGFARQSSEAGERIRRCGGRVHTRHPRSPGNRTDFVRVQGRNIPDYPAGSALLQTERALRQR